MGERSDFDREELLARVGGDRELMREVIALFLEQVPQHLSALRAAAADGDGPVIARVAHTFKGSIVVFAAQSALAAVAAVEQACAAGDMAATRRAIGSLEAALAQLCGELREVGA